jgi:hypothetical protein
MILSARRALIGDEQPIASSVEVRLPHCEKGTLLLSVWRSRWSCSGSSPRDVGSTPSTEYERGDVGDVLFKVACNMGLEGIVSKHLDRPYGAGRCKHWIKIKNSAHPAYSRVGESIIRSRRQHAPREPRRRWHRGPGPERGVPEMFVSIRNIVGQPRVPALRRDTWQ